MPGAGREPFELVVVKTGPFRKGPDPRHRYAHEAVAFAVAAGDSAQIAGDLTRLRLVGQVDQGGVNNGCGGEGGWRNGGQKDSCMSCHRTEACMCG